MNTSKIATLYPYFLDSLRHASAMQTMEDLLVRQLQAALVPTSRSYSHSITLTDIDHPDQHADWLAEAAGVTIQEFAPERVFNWVRQQMSTLTVEYQPKPVTGWQVYLQATTRGQAAGPGLHLYATATSTELALVLRGLRAYQAKRLKRARRLLAQLHAYHAQQLATEAFAATAPVVVAGPATLAVSCYGLPSDEYHRRIDAAEDLEDQMRERYNRPDGRYGREIMWHPAFAEEYVASISGTSLIEITVLHQNCASHYNQGRQLDLVDYGYLRDILAEALADNPTPLAALRLTRALAWVEQAGTALAQPARMHSRPQADMLPLLAGVTSSVPQLIKQALAA